MVKVFVLSIMLLIYMSGIAVAKSAVHPAIAQFDGYIINGRSASQVESALLDEAAKVEMAENNRIIATYNASVNQYNELRQSELDQRNIVAQMSYDLNTNPYDFIDIGPYATHWLSINGSELTCRHSSVNGTQVHAKTFMDLKKAFREVEKNRIAIEDMKRNEGTIGKNYARNNFHESFAPFYEKKRDELLPELQKKEAGLTEVDCKVVLEKIENPLWGYVPFVGRTKDLTCKTSKKCKIAIIEDAQFVLQVGCTCGHALTEHKLKYKNKDQDD